MIYSGSYVLRDTSESINYQKKRRSIEKPSIIKRALFSVPVIVSSNRNAEISWNELMPYVGTKPLCGSVIMSKDLRDNLEKVNEIGRLSYNWNGNFAEPFERTLIDRVKVLLLDLVKQPEVFPTAADSIQLEYDGENNSYLEFQIYEKGNAEAFLIDRFGVEKEWEVEVTAENINSIIGSFYG